MLQINDKCFVGLFGQLGIPGGALSGGCFGRAAGVRRGVSGGVPHQRPGLDALAEHAAKVCCTHNMCTLRAATEIYTKTVNP